MIQPKKPSREMKGAGPHAASHDEVPDMFRHFPPRLVKWLRAFPGCCVLPVLLNNREMQIVQLARVLGLSEKRGSIERLRRWLNLLVEMRVIIAWNNPNDTRELLYSCPVLDKVVIRWLQSQWAWAREQVRMRTIATEKRVATLHKMEEVLQKISFAKGSLHEE